MIATINCHTKMRIQEDWYIYDGKPYKRVQSSTTVMSQEEYERMLLARGGFRSEWEDQPNQELSLDDLDLDVIRDTARKAVRVGRLDESVDTENAASLLDHFKLKKNGTLLNGAAVLFGKADRIDYPQLEIKMGWFKGTDQRVFLDNSHVQGNVFRLMDAGLAFCFKHLNLAAWTSGKIERDEELEIPADALREALVNAFAHRSYENRSQTIYLAIYDDRVEIKNPGKFPSDFNLARLFSPPIQHSVPRNEKIARVLYLRKSIETWGRGLTRIANECVRVGLPVPEVKEEYGCVTTTFKRPDWTGDNTPDRRTGIVAPRTGTASARTGTGHRLSGTGWTIIGTTTADNIGELLARLPKLRKDARVNVETVLHELIADKNATIPQICARTGMALRTINNALATLREAKILRAKGYEGNVSTVKTGTSEVISKGRTGMAEAINEVINEAIRNEPGINKPRLVRLVGKSRATVERAIVTLVAAGKIEHRGSKKTGGYYAI